MQTRACPQAPGFTSTGTKLLEEVPFPRKPQVPYPQHFAVPECRAQVPLDPADIAATCAAHL